MHNILKIPSKVNNYELRFIESLDYIINLSKQPNTLTFIDSNVAQLYPELEAINAISIQCIEQNKELQGVDNVIKMLSERRANINTKLIVIGGGILQDLVGFCASIYSRGIEYILVPTTLLAQADSCVGGKTSLNFQDRKNLLGTFYPPSSILIYPKFTQTLSKLDYISGLGEIYKFHILQNKINDFDLLLPLENMIYDGLKYKIDILSRDEFDKGERKFLNFGHTFGHALESTSKHEIPHGIAVIIGSMIAISISKELGYKVEDYEEVMRKGYGLIKDSKMTFKQEWFNVNDLLEIIKSDKKSTGKLTMVLINNKPILADVEDLIILKNILNKIYESI